MAHMLPKRRIDTPGSVAERHSGEGGRVVRRMGRTFTMSHAKILRHAQAVSVSACWVNFDARQACMGLQVLHKIGGSFGPLDTALANS